MTFGRTAIACLLAVAALAPGPAAHAHRGVANETCGVKGADVEQQTWYGRVVEKDIEDEYVRVYACSQLWRSYSDHAKRHGYRDRRFLGEILCDTIESCTWETVLALHDSRVRAAYTKGACSRYSSWDCATSMRVVDLTSGRSAESSFRTSSGSLSYFDLTTTGTAVWLEETPDVVQPQTSPPNNVERVRGLTLADVELAFDEGPDLSEMALGRKTLYWTNGGDARSSPVP